MSERKQLLNSQ